MKLYEFEGKKLFQKYGIAVPQGELVSRGRFPATRAYPIVLKAHVKSGGRAKAGGVLFADDGAGFERSAAEIFKREFQGERAENILVEEKIGIAKEYYASISYDTDARAPMLALSAEGGIGIGAAKIFPVEILFGIPNFFAVDALRRTGIPAEDMREFSGVIQKLWELFIKEYALLAEINPLCKTTDGKFIACDAKIILDDEKINPHERRFITMDGDIAVLASGGGASLLNMDALLAHGGRPANYTEYSGNPPADVVKDLTKRVLSRQGLKGCWVVGGIANFTDIYETLRGFVEGLREVVPKPAYPIVIRRDGPRQNEAFEMLRKVTREEGYDFHLFGGETPMAHTARVMVELAYQK